MAELTPEILRQIMPTLSKAKRELYAPMLNLCCVEFEINNERRIAAFLANLAHESNNLTRWEENLSYSAKRLTQVWPNRFPTLAAAEPYAHNPEALANKTYGGRMGNDRAGDGWKYRGRFPLQATGEDMYRKASIALKIPDLLRDPDSLMGDPLVGFRVSAWIYAVEKGGNQYADKQNLKALTKAINGGYNGLQERIDLYNRAMRVLPDGFKITDDAQVPQDDDGIPDFIEGAEIEDEDEDEPISKELVKDLQSSEEKEVKIADKPPDQIEGTPPPAPAMEIKASQPSLLSRITAFSFPAGALAAVSGIKAFVVGIPPWGWIVIGACFVILCLVGAWLYNESMKRAAERTRIASTAAADQTKNNIRYV